MFVFPKSYDVIVVGAGHAGIEAALAASRIGASTLMLTMNLDTIGQMSCNPSIGGLGKGHLVREIDALGGEMGLNTDATGIQFRMLNASKGASVRAPRAQSDKKAYQFRMKSTCEKQPKLDIQQGSIAEIISEDNVVKGVATQFGVIYHAKTVVITTGTFLQGLMHVGLKNAPGGRMGDQASGLSASLKSLNIDLQRLKTGTPPRINGRSIDFSKCIVQPGDSPAPRFSFLSDTIQKNEGDLYTLNYWKDGMFHVEQLPCWLTHTTEKTHEAIRANLDKSPMYCGVIEGVGPRYCPSIEDKIVRFADKERHQLFLEPEGRHTDEYYLQGCSTSLPFEVQIQIVRSIPGLENAEIMRPGYAVEYDFAPPTQIQATLETKQIQGLYFAGQINGTSGYEEAAAQGLMAGINAALKVQNKGPFILGREEAYIGVLIDDLITKGAQEPYRMFTSRAEYRLFLRQDNADIRLTERGHAIGLASEERVRRVREKISLIASTKEQLAKDNSLGQPLDQLLKRPSFTWANLPESYQQLDPQAADQVQTDIKYSGYLARDLLQIQKAKESGDKIIPDWVNYDEIKGLKKEAQIKLKSIRPRDFAQASRISGINPSDVALVRVYVRKGRPAAGTATRSN